MGYTPHVLVVGGGPLGTGLARDFAIRGLEVTLVDQGPLAAPRTGRTGGLLASGAQFAREDPGYAQRCLAENRTLFEIASHCVEDTGGVVVGDDLDGLQAACEDCSIAARRLSAAEATEREPGLDPAVDGALAVPDAAIDPSLLTVATARDAREYGADIRPRTTVTDIVVENDAVETVVVEQTPFPAEAHDEDTAEGGDDGDTGNGGDGDEDGADETDDGDTADGGDGDEDGADETAEGGDEPVRSDGGRSVPGTVGGGTDPTDDEGPLDPTVDRLDVDYVVNAAGADAAAVAALADCSVPVAQGQSTVTVAAGRPVETAVTRPAAPGEAPDTAVPVGQHTLLATEHPSGGDAAGRPSGGDAGGTHPESAGGGRAGHDPGRIPSPSAVDDVDDALSALVAGTGRTQRAFRIPRDEFDPGDGRDFAVLDHDRQGCWGLLTVLGGTVTTHRWVAERVCDRVCGEFGIQRACQTDELLLPGAEDAPDLAQAVGTFGLAESVYEHSKRRLGSQTSAVLHTDGENPVVCPCQSVTRSEVAAALDDETNADADLGGLRVRTSATTGRSQGGRCGHQLATQLYPGYDGELVEDACTALLDERWQGQRPLAGPQRTEMARTYRLHAGTMNRGSDHEMGYADIGAYDDGLDDATDRPTCCPRVGWES
jgi:glycerol-3-phosphate dehydrogenase